MLPFLQKLPFLVELFLNGSFIGFYALNSRDKLPSSWGPDIVYYVLEMGAFLVPFVIFFTVVVNYLNSKGLDDYIRKYIFSLVVFVPLLITWGDIEFAFWLSAAHLLSSIMALYDNDYAGEETSMQAQFNFFDKIKLSPAQIVLLTFCGVILTGTFLLMLPVSSASGQSLSFIDGLFMSTSATCVTGLATKSLGTDFSFFGQIVILILIQIGGLSIMTLYSSMAILLGKSMGMGERIRMQDLLEVSSLEELIGMILSIIKYTFLIELWGGIVLTIAFTFDGFEFSKAIYYGFFHSISAFCNAGFSLFDSSLEGYATNPLISGTIMILITLGGVGFIVLREITEVITKKRTILHFTLHTKIVLVTSIILTLSGAVFIFFSEFLNSLDPYNLWEKSLISLFQSVTLRTAGFNTISLSNLNSYTIYGMALFMFIGASPGSTGGGVKTTTLAILIQSIRATLKGKKTITVFDRTISNQIIVKVTALTFISLCITSLFILILMNIESEQAFLPLFFEVISASGTVGLSLGITGVLSVAGKVAISLLMLIGRIGPLTLVLAIGEQTKSTGKIEYPEGRMMIG